MFKDLLKSKIGCIIYFKKEVYSYETFSYVDANVGTLLDVYDHDPYFPPDFMSPTPNPDFCTTPLRNVYGEKCELIKIMFEGSIVWMSTCERHVDFL